MVGKDVENVRNSYGENATDFIIEIKHNLVKYMIVVGYNLVVLFGYSLAELLQYFHTVENMTVFVKIIVVFYSMINLVYLLGFIFNVERFIVLINVLSCGQLFKDFKEIRKTNQPTLFELIAPE